MLNVRVCPSSRFVFASFTWGDLLGRRAGRLAFGSFLGVLLWSAVSAEAKPRPPLPPAPEPGVLRTFRFDEALRPPLSLVEPAKGQEALSVESWSGLALRMAGEEPILVQYPEVEKDGRTNIHCRIGSLRFWFKPDWSSANLGGNGPGSFARLIEMGAPSRDARTGWWSLYLNPEGTSIHFSAQGGGRNADYLQAPIYWEAGVWHEILLMYDAASTQLFIDGEWMAKGEGVSIWPEERVRSTLGFAVGSDMAGKSLAQGEFDELTTYRRPLGLMEWYWVSRMRARLAELGPITPEEEQGLRPVHQPQAMFTVASGPPPPGGGGGAGGSGGGGSSPSPYSASGLKLTMPKLVNQGSDMVFWVLEPQANAVYELQFATNLNSPIAWSLLARGLAGQTNYVVPRPNTPNGFFRLRVPHVTGPPILIVPEDTSLVVTNLQLNGFSGTNGTVNLRATKGFLQLTVTSGLALSGNLTSNLTATGSQAALNTALASLRYQGQSNYFGPDSLKALLTNAGPAGAISELLTISITVTPVNDAPTTVSNAYSVAEDATLLVPAPGVLGNDTDVENDPLSAVLVSSVSHGGLTFRADGSFTYVGAPNYNGPDSFSYRATDGVAGNTVTVALTVTPVNDPPSIFIISPSTGASVAAGTGINLEVWATDGDGSVASVSYYKGANLVAASSGAAPFFSITWTNPGVGIHTLTARATDNSGAVGVSSPVTFSVSADCDNDGISDAVEIIQGTDPCDASNGAVALLTVVSGNYQTGPAFTALPQLLKVKVANAAGVVRANVPVSFTVATGAGSVALSTNGPWTNAITLNSDSGGLAAVGFRLPGAGMGLVQASAGSNASLSRVTFVEAVAGPVESSTYQTFPIAVSAGYQHTLALLQDGTMRAWGWNESGQLGVSTSIAFSATPIPVPNLSNVVAISAGAWHSMALKSDGTITAWGSFFESLPVTPPTGISSVMAVAGGVGHSMILRSNGTVQVWGDQFSHITTPSGLSGVIAIAAGHDFGLALKSDGTVVAWGLGGTYPPNVGQLNVPSGLNTVIAIAAGDAHGLALRSNGTVVAWGQNNYGQASVPASLTNVIAIDAGLTHSLALKSDGTVVAWGNASWVGQLSSLNNVTAISAGASHSVALQAGGTVRAWGNNTHGELGNGSLTNSATPVLVSNLPPPATTNFGVQFRVFTPLK